MLLEKIKPLIASQFIYEGDLKMSTRIVEDLGADSFDIPVFLNSLEDQFGLTIRTEEVIGLKTLGDFVSLIQTKLQEDK